MRKGWRKKFSFLFWFFFFFFFFLLYCTTYVYYCRATILKFISTIVALYNAYQSKIEENFMILINKFSMLLGFEVFKHSIMIFCSLFFSICKMPHVTLELSHSVIRNCQNVNSCNAVNNGRRSLPTFNAQESF